MSILVFTSWFPLSVIFCEEDTKYLNSVPVTESSYIPRKSINLLGNRWLVFSEVLIFVPLLQGSSGAPGRAGAPGPLGPTVSTILLSDVFINK